MPTDSDRSCAATGPTVGTRGGAQISGRVVGFRGGPEQDRTVDLRIANAALSQLSYRPERWAETTRTAAGVKPEVREFSPQAGYKAPAMKLTTLHQLLIAATIALGVVFALRGVVLGDVVGGVAGVALVLVATWYLRAFRSRLWDARDNGAA